MTDIVERLEAVAEGQRLANPIDCREAAEEIRRLQHNQMSTDYVTLAQAAALQAQRGEALERKCEQFTKALLSAITLVDEMLRENARLCAASNEPPDVKLFAAKRSFDTEMQKLLSDS